MPSRMHAQSYPVIKGKSEGERDKRNVVEHLRTRPERFSKRYYAKDKARNNAPRRIDEVIDGIVRVPCDLRDIFSHNPESYSPSIPRELGLISIWFRVVRVGRKCQSSFDQTPFLFYSGLNGEPCRQFCNGYCANTANIRIKGKTQRCTYFLIPV